MNATIPVKEVTVDDVVERTVAFVRAMKGICGRREFDVLDSAILRSYNKRHTAEGFLDPRKDDNTLGLYSVKGAHPAGYIEFSFTGHGETYLFILTELFDKGLTRDSVKLFPNRVTWTRTTSFTDQRNSKRIYEFTSAERPQPGRRILSPPQTMQALEYLTEKVIGKEVLRLE